ncbi:MAG TPA: hypothetical protein VHX44_14185 [Planctomycetota bacterium]|nr:hypothetical protein [Planctomycetota bacterium]
MLIWVGAIIGMIGTLGGAAIAVFKTILEPTILTRYIVDQTGFALAQRFDHQRVTRDDISNAANQLLIAPSYPPRNKRGRVIDSWGGEVTFALVTNEDGTLADVVCISPGRDGVLGTSDDIRSDRGSLPAQPQP